MEKSSGLVCGIGFLNCQRGVLFKVEFQAFIEELVSKGFYSNKLKDYIQPIVTGFVELTSDLKSIIESCLEGTKYIFKSIEETGYLYAKDLLEIRSEHYNSIQKIAPSKMKNPHGAYFTRFIIKSPEFRDQLGSKYLSLVFSHYPHAGNFGPRRKAAQLIAKMVNNYASKEDIVITIADTNALTKLESLYLDFILGKAGLKLSTRKSGETINLSRSEHKSVRAIESHRIKHILSRILLNFRLDSGHIRLPESSKRLYIASEALKEIAVSDHLFLVLYFSCSAD